MERRIESVWDYPRPPRVEPCTRRARVVHRGVVIADSSAALRVLETSHPPAIYLPPDDVRTDLLRASTHRTFCEFKGWASYWDVAVGGSVGRRAVWSYPDPAPGYEEIRDYFSFYPSMMDTCYLDEEQVSPQAGGFYGGWVTADIAGPFKGGPGTAGW